MHTQDWRPPPRGREGRGWQQDGPQRHPLPSLHFSPDQRGHRKAERLDSSELSLLTVKPAPTPWAPSVPQRSLTLRPQRRDASICRSGRRPAVKVSLTGRPRAKPPGKVVRTTDPTHRLRSAPCAFSVLCPPAATPPLHYSSRRVSETPSATGACFYAPVSEGLNLQ